MLPGCQLVIIITDDRAGHDLLVIRMGPVNTRSKV